MGDANANVVVPGGPVPVATPGFDGSSPVPSFGQSASTPDPSMQVNNMAKAIMQRLAQASQRKQFAGTPVPAAVPGMQDPNAARKIGMDTANPNAWGKQRLMNGIATNISNAVAKQKQQKLLKAEADWSYMGSALNELYAAQASNDPKAIASAQQKVDVVLGDPKKLKEMAKALNQDWLNPEKTTVYGEALKKVTAKAGQDAQQQADQQKAATGLKGLFQKLMQKNQQPQLSDDQKKAMSAEILAKAPTSVVGGASIKEQAEGAKAVLELEQASKAARSKYVVKVGADGTAWAYNESDPKDAFKLKDAATGDDLTGQLKPGAAPKVMWGKGGVPFGVTRNGKALTPESPEWTKDDQTLFDGAIKSGVQAQQLKIPTIVADEIGAPPNPDNYKLGTSDPAYGKALKEYGEAAEAVKRRMDTAAGIARAKASNDFRPVQVMDNDGNVYYTTAAAAINQGLAGASEGGKLRPKQAQMKDIETASSKMGEAIDNLKPGDFSPDQVALLSKAMSEDNEGIAHTLFQNAAMRATNDRQQDFIIWATQLNERAMSLRNIAGMGAGAQDLRNAIRAMIPGIASGDTKMMKKQLAAFNQQVTVLEEGVPSPGKGGAGKLVGPGAKADMETQVYNGATYQRKKGSNDQWTLAPSKQ